MPELVVSKPVGVLPANIDEYLKEVVNKIQPTKQLNVEIGIQPNKLGVDLAWNWKGHVITSAYARSNFQGKNLEYGGKIQLIW